MLESGKFQSQFFCFTEMVKLTSYLVTWVTGASQLAKDITFQWFPEEGGGSKEEQREKEKGGVRETQYVNGEDGRHQKRHRRVFTLKWTL